MKDSDSSMISDNGYTSGLSEYTKDGLEIFVHNDGSVYADLTAISRMVDMSQGAIYSYVVKTCDWKNKAITHKRQAENGLRPIDLYPVSVVVACAKKYSPTLMEKFAEMGAMVYLYKLAGYKMKVEVTPEKPLTQLDIAKQAQKLLNEQVKQLEYLANKPGLNAIIATAQDDSALLQGFMSFDEMCQHRYIPELGLNLKKVLSKELTATIGNFHRAQVKTKNVPHLRENQKTSYYKVKAFPVDCLAAFDNVIAKYSK